MSASSPPLHSRPNGEVGESFRQGASSPRSVPSIHVEAIQQPRCSGSEALTSGELRVAVTAASRVRATEIDDRHQHAARR